MSTKTNILALLEGNRGQSISGEGIAAHLGVSRNAVWKAVNELKKDGYNIEAVTNKGYCLSQDNDILSAQGMLPYLTHKENADQIFVYDTLESTNITAKEMAIAKAKHGTVIIAEHQTSGRGRYNRVFHSPSGHGIYMSLILRPTQLGFSTPTLVTSFAAVCVCEAIEAITNAEPKIKWVNDIFMNGKKICGILTEAVTDFESGSIEWVVVGIGINFSTPLEAFPKDLREIVSSVFPDGRSTATRNQLVAEIVNRMVSPEQKQGEADIMAEYKQRLFMLGKEVLVSQVNETYKATALDVDEIGRLLIQKKSGEVLPLSSGEISIKPIS
ncbi:MAG TPA: biotin--[acetyl-CoA-carboxylase] ligase [Lachnospiraceae bacterium]|nr:biotin--[acetyl-CoA-carboxylase] ligase [Lachnospiraceae bacterium]